MPRKSELPSITIKVPTAHGIMYTSVSVGDGKPFEAFVGIGKEIAYPACSNAREIPL